MKDRSKTPNPGKFWVLCLLTLAASIGFASSATGFTLNVVDHDNAAITGGFNWLLEEDNTNLTVVPDPGAPVTATKSISLDIHKSYAPVAAGGSSTTSTTTITPPDPNGRYVLSILPDSGYSIGGTTVSGDPAAPVTLVVHKLPIPTAQISILAFQDHAPINNAPDDGELGLENAVITLHDAAGQLMQDAFGNPLGTTYNPDGSVLSMGRGFVLTDSIGEALVKHLSPGKYGVIISPPAIASPGQWIQTSTIEGTKTVDAWVKADEPEQFVEGFGAGFYHVFVGFVNPDALPGFPAGGTNKITGNLRYNHFGRPPANQGFFDGPPVKDCWVGINDPVSGQGLYAAPCFDGLTPSDVDNPVGNFPNDPGDIDHNGNGIFDGPIEVPSSFSIPDVPPGTYDLVTWDKPLDALFGFKSITMPAAGDLDLGTILSFRWFGSLLGTVYLDSNENGIQDNAEIGLAEQNINIRFRDGTIYQAQPTDIEGGYALEEVFPFFKWLVVEVDFARFKATGMTAAVDYGGEIPGGFDENDPWLLPTFEQLNPQPQALDNPLTGNNLSRTETGEVLTQAMHLFLNQTNVIDWGKQTYTDTENGGISGVVMYAVTRAENDPRFAAGEEWEPGIPRVQINLYEDSNNDKIIDDLNKDGGITLADVDNYPFDNFPGTAGEDIDHNNNGVFDPGDAISITTTDSWNDSPPSGCIQDLPIVHGEPIPECADAFGTWNQIRPGIFDGGYAFTSHFPDGIASGSNEIEGLPAGKMYIVEATTPSGYELLKEEDKNVDFGNEHQPSTQLLPPYCVGDDHIVPQYVSFQTDALGVPLPAIDPADLIDAPYAGDTRPLCNRKQIGLNAKENAAADFFFFTRVPKAARAVGFANNDLSAEFNQGSPNFGEKAAPSWIPVSFQDWKGNELTRVYTDEFGAYNAMLPSTFTVNIPSPTGVSPNMITLVLNDPFLPDGSLDPRHNPDYSVTGWTFHYEAGRTTYLDTPLVPVASFVNFPQGTLDIQPQDGTPVIDEVAGVDTRFGPVICQDVNPVSTITITSAGLTEVDNPNNIENDPSTPPTIFRDFGFGTIEGQVLIDGLSTGITIDSWANDAIQITVDSAAVSATGVLTIVRGDNDRSSETGMTLTVVADCTANTVHFVSNGGVYPATPIQDVIDAVTTNPGDLILVGKGDYNENVIMHKPVRLQGAGAGVTSILANPTPAERLSAWHTDVRTLLGTPGADPFTANEAPGILVLKSVASDFNLTPSSIDGFTLTGSISGGGIYVHSLIHALVISNNEVFNNQGIFAGGIIVGTPDTGLDADNDNIEIRGNRIVKNGGIQGSGGLAIYTGATNYLVENNFIAGNFSRFSGAGIAHVGLSDNGTIRNNRILFNEVFYGLNLNQAGDGGGIHLAGEVIGEFGAGSVTVNANLVQGNLAGSGNGGGINTYAFNGARDVTEGPFFVDAFSHTLTITNNIIANNVAGEAGGGIFLHDAADATIVNNTIVHNDTTATTALSFAAGATDSTPHPAGLVASAYTTDLAAAVPGTYPQPTLENNIIWHNRSFYSDSSRNSDEGGLEFDSYWDLAVVGTGNASDQMNISYSVLSNPTGPNGENYNDASNISNSFNDPAFVHYYTNDLFSAAVLDEGGNAISVRFTPLYVSSVDYHLTNCSPVIDEGADLNAPAKDFDGDSRTAGTIDIGADEFVATQTVYPALTLLSPVGGEIIPGATNYTISWGAPDLVFTTFDLAYSLDNGVTWIDITTGLDATLITCFSWTLPEEIQANAQVLVRVTGKDGTGAIIDTDQSAVAFTIDVDALISPNGGETLVYDVNALPLNTYTIEWLNPYTADPTDKISLEYQIGSGGWNLIATNLPGDDTSYSWEIPVVTELTEDVRVRLIIADSSFVNRLVDISDNPFTIRPAAPIPPATPPDVPAVDPPPGDPLPTSGAGVNFQCPDATGALATVSVIVDDGMYRADDGEITNPASPQQVCLHLAAGDGFVVMADGRPQYMFGFGNVTGIPDADVMNMWNDTNPGGMLSPTFPAPLIKVKEGDELYLTLTNVGMMMRPDLFDPHTVHWHGFPNAASIFDGVPDASISINMGSSLTYYYNVVEPGTFMYHCHVEATEHMQMGMLGNLYVAPAQDGTSLGGFTQFAYNDGDGSTGYNREYYFQITAFDPEFHDASENTQPLPFADMDDKYPMLNGRGYPDTVRGTSILFADDPVLPDINHPAHGHVGQVENALITASAGEHILLRISSLSTTSFHTLTVLGIPMRVVGKGSRKLENNQYYYTNTVTLGGGQSVDVILEIPATVSPGDTFFIYTTNLDHLTNNDEDYGGMMTEIVIE